MNQQQIMAFASGLARRVGRSVARIACLVLLVALALYVLFFSLLGLAFVVALGAGLFLVLIGRGPEQWEQAIVFIVGFPVALVCFLMLSLPGFLFVISIARAFRGHTTDHAITDIRKAMTS